MTKINYEVNFKYICHDCGTSTSILSVKINNELDYDLCSDCLEERKNEADIENESEDEEE